MAHANFLATYVMAEKQHPPIFTQPTPIFQPSSRRVERDGPGGMDPGIIVIANTSQLCAHRIL